MMDDRETVWSDISCIIARAAVMFAFIALLLWIFGG